MVAATVFLGEQIGETQAGECSGVDPRRSSRALGFAFFGGIKLAGRPGMVQEFAQIGMGQVASLRDRPREVGGAVGVPIPKRRFRAALRIATVKAGPTITNLARQSRHGNRTAAVKQPPRRIPSVPYKII